MSSRFSALRAFFLLIGVLVLPALACDFSVSTASITNGVMAKDVKGDKFEPVDVTSTYSANQVKFHAVVSITNAPSDTLVKATWFAVDVGSAAAPNTLITETEVKVEGSRNVDFTLTPTGNGWPPGAYKVDIYLNGKLDRTLNFTVAGAPAQPTAAAKPTVAAPTSPAPKPSGYVNNVTLAESTTGDKEPVSPTIVFKPTATFHAVVRTQNAPANTKFKASWYASDVGNVAPANSLLDETELVTDGSRNIDFSISPPPTKWPVGTYRVEIKVNGVLDRIVSFGVSASSSGQPPAVPPTAALPTQAKPTSTSQAAPAVPPGSYVSALRLEPGPKRGVEITFYPMFLNTTSGTSYYRVRVYLYRADNLRTSFGETSAAPITIPVGSTEQKAAGSWKLGGGGGCEDFIARVGWIDDQNRITFFNAPAGGTFESRFQVCP